MKPKTLLVLTVLVAILAAFIFFFEKDLPSTDERAEMEKKVLAPLEGDDVEAVEISWEGQSVRLEKERDCIVSATHTRMPQGLRSQAAPPRSSAGASRRSHPGEERTSSGLGECRS